MIPAVSLDPSTWMVFLESCREHLQHIERDVLNLEDAKPESWMETVGRILRAAHSIKGDAGTIGLEDVVGLAHRLEDLLVKIRDKRLHPGKQVIDGLLKGFDLLKRTIENPRAEDRDVAGDVSALLEKLSSPPSESANEAYPQAEPADAAAKTVSPEGIITSVHIAASHLDSLVDRIGEMGTLHARLSKIARQLNNAGLRAVTEDVGRLGVLLRMQVMEIRMLPIRVICSKYRRLVRDLSSQMGREAELAVRGDDTELDKSMIEGLNNILVHLIRNAVGHGLESPEERLRAGKPRRGTVEIAAEHSGNEVLLTVSDDGRGIDTEALYRQACEKGFFAAGTRPSDDEIVSLIFRPGVTTSLEIDTVSGRGVGMDAVREGIASMRGRIDVASRWGEGTKFQIRLPLSMAIIDCLKVRLDGADYYIHIDFVEECFEVSRSRARLGEGGGVLTLRGSPLGVMCLRKFFRLPPPPDLGHVVVVHVGGRRFGVIVDEVQDLQQVMVKKLGALLKHVTGVQGAAIQEDGGTALILDLNGLLEKLDVEEL